MLGVRCEAARKLTRLGIIGVRCEALVVEVDVCGVVCESLSGRVASGTASGTDGAASAGRDTGTGFGPERSSAGTSSRSEFIDPGSAPRSGAILGVAPDTGGGGRLIPDGPDCGRLVPEAEGTKALSCCRVAAT